MEIAVDIQHQLEKQLAGEIKFDLASRVLYSTDASIYQVEPLGVVFPKHREDLIAVMETASRHGIPVLPRGSGSSLAGQTVGAALVIDFSRYMNRVLEVSPEEKTAWVQPGLVLSQFNSQLQQYGLEFGPDPASGERATLGGICGNNSTGAHSMSYGMAIDHVLEMEAVLSDGGMVNLSALSLEEAEKVAVQDSLLASICQTALDIRANSADVIQKNWPKTWRNSSGYAINYLVPWSGSQPPAWNSGSYPPLKPDQINLAQLLVGSEGTLGVFARMKVGLVDVPIHKVLCVLEFDSVAAASERTPSLLELEPSAVELVPRAILEKARAIPAYASRLAFLKGSPAAILLVEFSGAEPTKLVSQAKRIGSDVLIIEDPVKQKQLWEVRKVGLGLLMFMVGDAKPIPFIEDMAVPVEQLGSFVRDFERVLAEFGTVGNFYAHASAGCLHIRPIINTKSADDIKKMIGISEEMVKVTLKYNGALSGEHGDGLARAMWLEKVYSPEVVDIFRQVKQVFDPKGILNPGKIVELPPMDEHLRFGAEYSATPWEPLIDFSSLDGLAGAIEMCNGAGVCRKASGAMCPTFQASGDEMHSTRGRANLLREYISGKLIPTEVSEKAAFEALQMCLACKGCKAECPSAVDVATLKYEFMNHYYQSYSRPLRDFLFGYIGEFALFGMVFPGLVNLFTGSKVGKSIMERFFGISSKRQLPALTRSSHVRQPKDEAFTEEILLLSDPFSEFFTPELLRDMNFVLSKIGVRSINLPVVGAGRTKLSKGFIRAAMEHANKLVAHIQRIDPDNMLPILGIEPSEIAMLTDDLSGMLPRNSVVASLPERTFSLSEYLLRPGVDGEPRYKKLNVKGQVSPVLIHGHCHQKAKPPASDGIPNGVQADIALFEHLGCPVELIDSGCCGMAGSFGYEKEHYEMSERVAETYLLPAVRTRVAEQQVLASGASCRAQIESLAGETALHPNQFLASLLR